MDQKSGIQKQTKRSEKISLRKLGEKKPARGGIGVIFQLQL